LSPRFEGLEQGIRLKEISITKKATQKAAFFYDKQTVVFFTTDLLDI
jgi:hypothetical protein